MALAHTSLDLYGFQIHLATTKADYRELRQQFRWLAKHNPDESGSCSFYVDIPKVGLPTPHLVLWIDTNRITTEADLIETVAHEAAHGANHVAVALVVGGLLVREDVQLGDAFGCWAFAEGDDVVDYEAHWVGPFEGVVDVAFADSAWWFGSANGVAVAISGCRVAPRAHRAATHRSSRSSMSTWISALVLAMQARCCLSRR